MTPRRRPHRGPAHGGSSPSVVAQQGRTTGRRSVPHVSLGGLSRAAVVWAVALGLLPLHGRQGLGVLWRVARSLEGDRLDHQSHTCDRQAAIRIWARHPGLTGAGEGVTSVPSACQLPEQPPICYHIGCSNVWSRAILSVHCARTSGRAPARGPTHAPSIAPISRGEGVQATGGPEQVWRVLKIRRSFGLQPCVPCRAGPRVPWVPWVLYVVEAVVALQRAPTRHAPVVEHVRVWPSSHGAAPWELASPPCRFVSHSDHWICSSHVRGGLVTATLSGQQQHSRPVLLRQTSLTRKSFATAPGVAPRVDHCGLTSPSDVTPSWAVILQPSGPLWSPGASHNSPMLATPVLALAASTGVA